MTGKRDAVQIALILQAFPALRNYCNPAKFKEFKSSVWDDNELLQLVPGFYGEDGCVLQEHEILFLNETGDVIAVGGKYPTSRRSPWNPLTWFLCEHRDEQVLETMLRLKRDNIAKDVKLVVGLHIRYDLGEICVYHPPENCTNLQEWLDTVTGVDQPRQKMVA